MRIRPTELGWKGLLLLASLELAFLATSYSNLFFLLIAFCAVLGGLGVVWALQNLRPVRIERIEVRAGPAGQPRALQVTLTTGKRRCFDLAVRLRCGRERFEVAHTALLRGTLQLDGVLPARARGIETVRVQLRKSVTRHFEFDIPMGPMEGMRLLFEKQGVPILAQPHSYSLPTGNKLELRFTPGTWELVVTLADGRTEHFPFVVTSDTEAPTIGIRLTR